MLKTYTELTPEVIASKLEALQHRAEHATTWRGHTLTPWELGQHKDRARAKCELCGASVMVIVNPAPNEIDIGGEAVAVGHVDQGHSHREDRAGRQVCCKVCHVCGRDLEEVLDGELWCSSCYRYR